MRVRRYSLLALALVFIASLAVVGCGGASAQFTVSNLVISPTSVEAGSEVQISMTVTNSGGASGNYNVDLSVDGTPKGSQMVEVAAGSSTTVTFDYTPEASGTVNIVLDSLAGPLSGSLTVTPSTGYWEIPYECVEGTWIDMWISIGGITPLEKHNEFPADGDMTFTMRVSKTVEDGAREVIVSQEKWDWPYFMVYAVLPGIDMNLALPLGEDAHGTLYVEDGVGDVDVYIDSTSGNSPTQEVSYGDGDKDPAGSMLLPIILIGDYITPLIPQGGLLPFDLYLTTGYSHCTIHSKTNKKLDDFEIEDEGVLFEKDGGVAPYVGTAGEITMLGTGDCLGITLVGFRMDMGLIIHMAVAPVE